MLVFNYDRACRVGEAVGLAGHVIALLKHGDPQFKAVVNLLEARGAGEAAVLVIANSLVSYQLNTRGEEYWYRFSEYFRDASRSVTPEELLAFMSSTGLNTRLLEQKKRRLSAFFASSLSRRLNADGLVYCGDLRGLYGELTGLYGGGYSKTVAFAVKMYWYLCEASGLKPVAKGVPPPLDLRNSLLLCSSCIAEGYGSLEDCVEAVMSRNRREALKALQVMCECSGLDCLELDVLTWLIVGVLRDTGFDTQGSRAVLRERFNIEIPDEILREFSRCSKRFNP